MTVDSYGNTVIKKDFWADGGWCAAFLLLPMLTAWIIIAAILIYGTYATFRYEPERIQAGFLFLAFAFLAATIAVPFAKSVWVLLTEKIIFTDERIVYIGFGSYAIPYSSIRRITIAERNGPFGKKRFLFFVALDEGGRERTFLIPRWKTVAEGMFAQELSRRTPLTLLDRGLLSFYASFHGRELWLAAILAGASAFFTATFLVARSSTEAMASITVFLWFMACALLIFSFNRYLAQKKSEALSL